MQGMRRKKIIGFMLNKGFRMLKISTPTYFPLFFKNLLLQDEKMDADNVFGAFNNVVSNRQSCCC